MSGESKKKGNLKLVSVVDIGCNSCKKPNFSLIFKPFPKKPKKPTHSYNPRLSFAAAKPTTSSSKTTVTSQWYSDTTSSPLCGSQKAVAVEKQSEDPYLDFRQSMLQMILENETYSKDDLRELLNCFLRLNEPYHHGVIVRAFTEIWDGFLSVTRGRGAASPLFRGYEDLKPRYSYFG